MVFSILAAMALGQQPTAGSLYTAYREKIAGLQSATGVVTVEMSGGPVRYEFKIQKPNRFVVASPKQHFISNGQKVWQYMPESQTYNEPPIEHYGAGPLLQPFLPFFEGVEVKRKPTEIKLADYDGKQSLLVVQKPDATISLTAVIDPESLLPVAWIQKMGQNESVQRFTDIKTNVEIDASSFTLPAGAKPMETTNYDSSLLPVGAAAPEFSLDTPDGKIVRLAEELKGSKAVWLNFWFYGCGPCQEELPQLQKISSKLRSKGLRTVTVNQGDPASVIRAFLKEKKFDFKVGMNGKGGPDVSKLYGVTGYPTNYLISPEGKVIARFVGYNEKALRTELSKLGLDPGK